MRYPNAVRVQPSQGDGGIDIFVPGPAGFTKQRAVYQVKSYCQRLTSSQKRKIKTSYQKVIDTSNAENWAITEWHLVMPVDMTDNELEWLKELTANAEFPCEPHGLLFCDTLASDYPKVPDYYLRDGKERLQAELNNLTALLSGRKDRQENEPLAPTDVLSDLASIHKALNACDPFYRYNFAVSDNPPSSEPQSAEPGLVAVFAMQQDSVWVTFKIIALSLASLEESPVSMELKLAIPDGDAELQTQVQMFIDYGTPLSMPAGTVSGSISMPGGLGGDLSGGALELVTAAEKEDWCQRPLSILIGMLLPDSETLIASTKISRTTTSMGTSGGIRSVWADSAGLFTIEILMKPGGGMTMGVAVDFKIVGRKPADVVDSVEFLAAMHAPNQYGLSRDYGPKRFDIVGPAQGEPNAEAQLWARICDALAQIQDHTEELLLLPANMTVNEGVDVLDSARLLAGEPIRGQISGQFSVMHDDSQVERELDSVYQFCVINELKFSLGAQVISVGKEALFFNGKYIAISDEKSTIEPSSEGVSIRYSGEHSIGRVLAGNLTGAVQTDEG